MDGTPMSRGLFSFSRNTDSYLDIGQKALEDYYSSRNRYEINEKSLIDISLGERVQKYKSYEKTRKGVEALLQAQAGDVPDECPRCGNMNADAWWYTAQGRRCFHCNWPRRN